MDDLTLRAFLFWILTGPGVAGVLAVLGELPYARQFLDRLSYDGKRLVFLTLSMLVPLLATWGAVALAYLPSTPDTWFRALAAGWAGFTTSQIVHLFARKAPDA